MKARALILPSDQWFRTVQLMEGDDLGRYYSVAPKQAHLCKGKDGQLVTVEYVYGDQFAVIVEGGAK